MKAAATFLTLGHLTKANIVSKLPKIPMTIIKIVDVAAKVSSGRENLKWQTTILCFVIQKIKKNQLRNILKFFNHYGGNVQLSCLKESTYLIEFFNKIY